MDKAFKVRLELPGWESEVMEIEAKNWAEVCNYIFGKIQIIDTEEV